MDDQQRARELLAAEWDRVERPAVATAVRSGRLTGQGMFAVQAITAALRAAPEGFAVSPEDPSPSMIRAGLLFGLSPNQACAVYQSMLAARPQEVKDAE